MKLLKHAVVAYLGFWALSAFIGQTAKVQV